MQDLLLKHRYALGDTVLMTALVRDLSLAYPGQYKIWVQTNWGRVWDNNPRVSIYTSTTKLQANRVIELEYQRGIDASQNRGDLSHFISWYHKDLASKLGVHVPVTEPKGEIFLTEEEKQPLVSGRYWVVVAGGKLDITTKHWPTTKWQRVVDELKRQGLQFVQTGATHYRHIHVPLKGVLNAIGKAENIRDLFSLIYNSEGVICGITGAMHIAACFDKPCVVIAGGRERPEWEAYVNQKRSISFGPFCKPIKVEHEFLHTIGQLPCATEGGCWKAKTVPLQEDDTLRSNAFKLCVNPVKTDPSQPVPACMDMIEPEHVIESVLSYYKNKELVRSDQLPVFVRDPIAVQEQTPKSQIAPVEYIVRPAVPRQLGGRRFTICVLCYGAYPGLAIRCIDSIKNTTVKEEIDLRVGCNDCCPDTIRYLQDQNITKLYINNDNKLKYPAMRDMFWDREHPITTDYVIWFDDDSFVVDGGWLAKLSAMIDVNEKDGVGAYGWKFTHDFGFYYKAGHDPSQWFKQGTWYRNCNWYAGPGRDITSPNGTIIQFVTGGWWCIKTDAIRKCDIPDTRLKLNGGDITIGAQLYQNGFKIYNMNIDKKLVFSSGAEPRGLSHVGRVGKKFPWSHNVKDEVFV
jgi:ADP-heptose:LPS heptosyltransferase